MPTSAVEVIQMAKLKKKRKKRVKHDPAYLAVLQEHNNLIVKDA